MLSALCKFNIFRNSSAEYIKVTSVRNVNFQSRNPREPHFDRKKMVEVTKPIFLPPDDNTVQWLKCPVALKTQESPHPYDVLLSKDLADIWKNSTAVLFYHYGPLKNMDRKEIRNAFYKSGMHFHVYDSEVLNLSIQGTNFSSFSHLFQSRTALLSFSDITLMQKALSVSRKFPSIVLLAGVVENNLYSRSQLQTIADLPKRDVHQELAQFLDLIPAQLSKNVTHHSQMLSYNLSQISKPEDS